jgi:hypothetical protein
MQVNWHVERLGAFEDYPIFLVVEKLAVNVTIDHGALEAKLRNWPTWCFLWFPSASFWDD